MCLTLLYEYSIIVISGFKQMVLLLRWIVWLQKSLFVYRYRKRGSDLDISGHMGINLKLLQYG